MVALAMWIQETGTTASGAFSASAEKWIVVWLGVIAISVLAVALVCVVGVMVALKAAKGIKDTVDEVSGDLKRSSEEFKTKLFPLVDGVLHVGRTTQNILDDAAPKLRVISDHLVETSRIVRTSAEKLDKTVGDVNTKTQRQVARVDGMVTAALNTTAEVAATIENGIKVPAKKIAQVALEVRFVAEGILEKLKAAAADLPFMQKKRPKPEWDSEPATPTSPYPARPVTPPTPRTATTPAGATGTIPLVK